jgi:dimethylamine monooxygenase subunit A
LTAVRSALGFSVEELLAAGRGGGALRMGLTRVAEDAWLQSDFDGEARRQVFAEHPQSVQMLPGAEAAAREAAEMTSGKGMLADAAVACWEDLCVLQAEQNDRPYRLTAAALGFPTDWRVEEKMGLPLTAIHAPIHGYAEQLAAGVDHFFRTLAAGPIFGRANWFVVASDAWRYLPTDDAATRFAHVTADNAGDTLFVRCERQTLRRLPMTGAVLFTIGIAVEPLRRLSIAAVRRVTDAITSISDGEHDRRAAPFYAGALARYTAWREAHHVEAVA